MKKLIAIFLLLMVSLIFGCAPRAPKISEIDKIAVLLSLKSGEEEITGEITNIDDLEFIAEALNALEPSDPSACPFDMSMTICSGDDTYIYIISCDGCKEIRFGTETNFRQYTFAEGHFYRLKEILANALLETKQHDF